MQKQAIKPVFLMTGFLGSGKTTLLNHLLAREEFSDTLVIINEFGKTGLDHLLVETSSDTILELSNGCLCCSVRGELVDTLLGLDTSRFRQVIIETTGIADPLPVYQSLAAQPDLANRFKPASIITVLDCNRAGLILEEHEEARNQLALADMIYLSKLDMQQAIAADITEIVRTINAHALIAATPDEITVENIATPITPKPDHQQVAGGKHASKFQSVVLETPKLLDTMIVAGLAHHLANMLGENLLRMKGLFLVREHLEKPLILQASGPVIHDFQTLEAWPEETAHTRLVVITTDVPGHLIQSVFDGFVGNLALDTADHQALTNNPLAIPGQTG